MIPYFDVPSPTPLLYRYAAFLQLLSYHWNYTRKIGMPPIRHDTIFYQIDSSCVENMNKKYINRLESTQIDVCLDRITQIKFDNQTYYKYNYIHVLQHANILI